MAKLHPSSKSKHDLRIGYLVWLILLVSIVFGVSIANSEAQIDDTVLVTHVEDGDTFKTSGGEWIRLAAIDCPESSTKTGNRASIFTAQLIKGKHVYIDRVGTGYYDRTLAYVFIADQILNSLLLDRGLATLYKTPD